MRYSKSHYSLGLMIYLPFFILQAVIYFWTTHKLYDGMSIHWLALPALCIALLSKTTNIRFIQYQEQHYSDHAWFFALVFINCAISILLIGFKKVFHLPETTASITHLNFFPFDLFSLFIIACAIALNNGKKGLISSTIYRWFQSEYDENIGIMTDAYSRFTNSCTFSLCAFVFAIFLMQIIAQHFNLVFSPKFCVGSALSLTAVFVITLSTPFRRTIRFLIKTLPPTVVILLSTCAILAFLYTFIFVFEKFLPLPIFAHFDFVHHLEKPGMSSIAYYMLALGWFLMYTGFVIHVSQGRSVRTTILVNLLIVFVCSSLLEMLSADVLRVLTLISCVTLFATFLNKKYISYVNRATLPKEDFIKQRAQYEYINTIIVQATLMLANYLCSGFFMVGYHIYVAVFPVAIFMGMGILALITSDCTYQLDPYPDT